MSRIVHALARHHTRVAAAAGAATLAAQRIGDHAAAAHHLAEMHAAQARRDALDRGEIVIPFRFCLGYAVLAVLGTLAFLHLTT